MSKWSDKVAASARARLAIPPGKLPSDFVETYKRFLKIETQRIRILHRGGAGGREVCLARSELIDLLLRNVFEGFLKAFEGQYPPEKLALVALGGYGRAELNPGSDVDIQVLHDRRLGDPSPLLHAIMGKFVGFTADIGIECHPLVRNLDDCVREARANMQSKTALLEARLVWGDARLFEQMRILLRDRCLKGREDAYLKDRLRDQEERRTKWGRSFCRLEPNVKTGCGGLRDYQSLHWMARVKLGVEGLADLVKLGKVSRSDAGKLDQAYEFLLRVRNELHYLQGRRNDTLTRAVQPAVAHHFGFTDRSLARRVERFMGQYYRHVRNLHLITANLERRLALRPPGPLLRFGRYLKQATRFRETIVDGFRILDGEVQAASGRVFDLQPRRLMRVFLLAQQRGLVLHPDLEDLIRQKLSLVNKAFLDDQRAHQTFIEILNQRGNVARTLRSMHETGLLGKYIPAFADLTCRVQHEFFHLYTADEHTLVCLEMLDRVWESRTEPFSHYVELFRGIDRPYVLYLALLLHDAGKAAHSGDHAVDSARMARSQTSRLRLPAPAAATVAFLVRHHLLMSRLSQKLDLDDPEVIQEFAATVQTPEHLHLLTLHTFADSMGTSETLWTPFKESLLWSLHRRTEQILAGSETTDAEDRLDRLREEVRRLKPRTFCDEEFDAHFSNLPERYFLIHTQREILTDLTLAHRFMWNQLAEEDRVLDPAVAWRASPDRGYSVLKVCCWDRPRLFSRIAGAAAAAGLNILSARVFSRLDGPVFDTLCVNTPDTGRPAPPAARERFEDLLARSLRGEDIDFPKLIARLQVANPMYVPAAYELIPTRATLVNGLVRGRTVLEIETEDRVGLLYELTDRLASLGLDIDFARINTEKGAAIDTFYLREAGGGAIPDARLRDIEQRLRLTLERRAPQKSS